MCTDYALTMRRNLLDYSSAIGYSRVLRMFFSFNAQNRARTTNRRAMHAVETPVVS